MWKKKNTFQFHKLENVYIILKNLEVVIIKYYC